MKIFVLGGTGSIGSAVVRELVGAGHTVTGLSRSEVSDRKLKEMGAAPLRGDLRAPGSWVDHLGGIEGIVQTAATFTDDMAQVDWGVIEALLARAPERSHRLRFIYTGGCWLYGATGNRIADEEGGFTPFKPFAWMLEHGERLLQAEGISAAILHPAMVYDEAGGVLSRFIESAKSGSPIEVWGSPDTRWPVVHRDDLAAAYRILLENPEMTGHFNASGQSGVRVGEIAAAIAKRYRSTAEVIVRSASSVVSEYGSWAEGPTLDQQMSSERLQVSGNWRPAQNDILAGIARFPV